MKSFAKINLYLEITGQRPDGYHLLDSLMVLVDIFDEINIEKSDDLELVIKSSDNSFLQQDWRENIVIKAVNLLAKEFGFEPKIKITLTKNIPVAAGLGGGSSNAAAIMLLLNGFYQLGLSQKQLLELGLKIGADAPFFLDALVNKKPVFVSGIGEVLKDFQGTIPNWYLLIVNPKKHLSTKQVFELRARDFTDVKNTPPAPLDRGEKPREDISPLSRGAGGVLSSQQNDILNLIQNHNNDLEAPAIKIMPEISAIINTLKQEKPLLARMSGSGASCFALFENANDLENCYQKLQRIFPDFYLNKTKFA
jgi:4-diphosphocytidyl-2-C-methyl-D-erythritol kinase